MYLSLENLKRGIHVVKAADRKVFDGYYDTGYRDAKRYFESKFR